MTKLKVHFRRSHEDEEGESREPLEWDYPSPPSSLWCWGGWRRPSAAPDLCRFPPSWSQWLEHISQVPCKDKIWKYFSSLILSVLPESLVHILEEGWRKVIQNRVARFLGSSTLIVARALLTEPDSQYNLSRPDQSSGWGGGSCNWHPSSRPGQFVEDWQCELGPGWLSSLRRQRGGPSPSGGWRAAGWAGWWRWWSGPAHHS